MPIEHGEGEILQLDGSRTDDPLAAVLAGELGDEPDDPLIELAELLGGHVNAGRLEVGGLPPARGQLGHAALNDVAHAGLAVMQPLAHDDEAGLATGLALVELGAAHLDGAGHALPPALARGAAVGDLAHVAVLLELPQVVARRPAGFAESLAEPARRLRSIRGERFDDLHPQRVSERLETVEVGDASLGVVRAGCHAVDSSDANISLQTLLCKHLFARRPAWRGSGAARRGGGAGAVRATAGPRSGTDARL